MGIQFLTLTAAVTAPPSVQEDQTNTRGRGPRPPSCTAGTAVVSKGSLYRNALFMIVIIIIVMII